VSENQKAWCWLIGGALSCIAIGVAVGAKLGEYWC
jgi:hypothetical protein